MLLLHQSDLTPNNAFLPDRLCKLTLSSLPEDASIMYLVLMVISHIFFKP